MMATEPTSTCYNPQLFVDSVALNFVNGGGSQTITTPLNTVALQWPNAQVTVGTVTGIDSGSVQCSVVDGNLVCNYVEESCPPPFTGGQCPGVNYTFTTSVTSNAFTGSSDFNNIHPGPIRVYVRKFGNRDEVVKEFGPNGTIRSLYLAQNSSQTLSVSVSGMARVDGLPDDCGDPPGECGGSSVGSVQLTYTGCFPQEQPPPLPPVEPPVPPLEPSPTPQPAPEPGGREGGPGLPGFGPGRRVTGIHIWERTVASNELPFNYDIPWYPIYGAFDGFTFEFGDPSFVFYLPPLFSYRFGASPSLIPWNGIAVYADPHGGNLELGSPYRSAYLTPRITMSSLTRLKRTYGVNIVANGFNEVVTPLDSTDASEWGDVRYRALINTTLTEPHRTSETNYDGFRSESGTTSYVIRETLKDVDAAPQAMWWSSDEGVWSVEGFQVNTGNKGERNNRIFGGF